MAACNTNELGFDVTFAWENEETSESQQNDGAIDRDDITCAICLFVLKEPVQALDCGHRFCTKCIREFHQKNPGKCPKDWQDIQVYPDVGKKREILNLKIRCPNFTDGCQWQHELRERDEHLKDCGYESISCRLECGEFILRKNMPNHVDVVCPMVSPCEYKDFGCLFKGTRALLDDHMRKNTNAHLSLEMKHEIQKVKEEFNEKLKTKDHEVQKVKADFNTQLKAKDREIQNMRKEVEVLNLSGKDQTSKNESIEENVAKMMKHIQTENSLKKLERQLADQNKLTMDTLVTPHSPFSWEIKNFKKEYQDVKVTDSLSYSPDFLTDKGYKGKIRVYLNGDRKAKGAFISVYFCSIIGPFDNYLEWPMPFEELNFTLLINDREVKTNTKYVGDEGGKWRNHFKRPIGGYLLGKRYGFDHKLVENVTDNDVVMIKFDIKH